MNILSYEDRIYTVSERDSRGGREGPKGRGWGRGLNHRALMLRLKKGDPAKSK